MLTTASLFEALRILLLLTLYLTAWKTEEGLVLERRGWAPPALLGLPPRKDSGRILGRLLTGTLALAAAMPSAADFLLLVNFPPRERGHCLF